MTSYAYDAGGALWQVTYPSGLRIQYDRNPATGEVVRVVNLDTGTKYADQVAHFPQGPVKSLAFGNGQTLSQSFNLRYEPLSISSGPLALAYTVSPSGDVTQIADTSREARPRVMGFAIDSGARVTRARRSRRTDSPPRW